MTHSLPLRDDVVALFPGQGSLSGGAGVAWRESAHWQLVATSVPTRDAIAARL